MMTIILETRRTAQEKLGIGAPFEKKYLDFQNIFGLIDVSEAK
jgi:hypothetical protein